MILIQKTILDDKWNKIIQGEILYNLIINKKNVGHMKLRLYTGQISSIGIDKIYRNSGYGILMLKYGINDRYSLYKKTDLFAVTIKEHPFWRKINHSEYFTRIDNSVTGSGYRINLVNMI
jgi:hypothetical protein